MSTPTPYNSTSRPLLRSEVGKLNVASGQAGNTNEQRQVMRMHIWYEQNYRELDRGLEGTAAIWFQWMLLRVIWQFEEKPELQHLMYSPEH